MRAWDLIVSEGVLHTAGAHTLASPQLRHWFVPTEGCTIHNQCLLPLYFMVARFHLCLEAGTRATRPHHQPQILLRAQPADREDDDVGRGRGAPRGMQRWGTVVRGQILSGNMWEGGNKKRDVWMICEGRGKEQRGERGEGWSRKVDGAEQSPSSSQHLHTIVEIKIKLDTHILERGTCSAGKQRPKSREWPKRSSNNQRDWQKRGQDGGEKRETQTNPSRLPPIHALLHHAQVNVPPACLAQEARGGGGGDEEVAVKLVRGKESLRKRWKGRMEGKGREKCSPGFTTLERQLLRDSMQEIARSEPREHRTSAKDDGAHRVHCHKKQRDSAQEIATGNPERNTKEHSPKNSAYIRQIRMVAHHDRRAWQEYLERDEGLGTEPDRVYEVDEWHAKRAKQPCMLISGPRSMAHMFEVARGWRRGASVMVEPLILGRKFSVVGTFVRLD
ncbi:hypothetical protein B0H13DRAFT_2535643 [Mycena leptocephala]|nr:hypothetical protein B0H13DRAFT_2535643 [Mycena leptocephala]